MAIAHLPSPFLHHLLLISLLTTMVMSEKSIVGESFVPTSTSRTSTMPESISATTTSAESCHNNIRSSSNNKLEALGGGAINEKPRLYKNSKAGKTSNENKEAMNNGGDHDDAEENCAGGLDNGGWDPSNNLSHLLHALVGLDRYPNYLQRFQHISDLDRLELALQQQLDEVKRQKLNIVERRRGIDELVRRYKAENCGAGNFRGDISEQSTENVLRGSSLLFAPPKSWEELRKRNILTKRAFDVAYRSYGTYKNVKSDVKADKFPDVRLSNIQLEDVISGKVIVDLNPAFLEESMDQEMFDVYSFPLLTPEFCLLLRTTMRQLSSFSESEEFLNLQFGRRPIDLETIGLGWLTDLLFHMFIQPISHHLFAATERIADSDSPSDDAKKNNRTPLLDWRQGYVAGYSANPTGDKAVTRHRLVPHTDDSEVTLNCCLGEETFEGGNVEFYGLRGTPEEGQLVGTVHRPNVGTALLHAGRHLHAVSDVVSGDRYSLIVWSRSWGSFRRRTCPCCYLNRRQDKTCICERRWN